MLDGWIIEKLKEREKDEEREQIRLPMPENPFQEDKKKVHSDDVERGVFIIYPGNSDEEDIKK